LLLRWRSDLSPQQLAARHFGPALPALLLAGWVLLTWFGYQGSMARRHQLEIAQSAPARVTYGDAAAPVIQVFTAPGCGPCKMLESQLKNVIAQGYAVQYIPSSLSGADWDEINAALCQTDPKAGFERLFDSGGQAALPPPQPGCQSGVRNNQAVLQKLAGQLVFPTVVMPDGLLLIGAPSESKLQTYLRAAAPLPAAAPTNGVRPL
jgi:thiol-disulfide isomerase/thioredoxin